MDSEVNITNATFQKEVLESSVPVLADFWAEWCVPCRALAPLLEKIAGQFPDKLKVVKFNVDDNKDVPARFGIRGLPTLLLFKGGEVMETLVGSQSRDSILRAVTKHL
jgi:thioredoxin 1